MALTKSRKKKAIEEISQISTMAMKNPYKNFGFTFTGRNNFVWRYVLYAKKGAIYYYSVAGFNIPKGDNKVDQEKLFDMYMGCTKTERIPWLTKSYQVV